MTNPLTPNPNEPPSPHGYRIQLLRTWGREDEAQALLDSLNRIRRAVRQPEYAMPEPLATGLPELCACPAERADLDPKELPDGSFQVAA